MSPQLFPLLFKRHVVAGSLSGTVNAGANVTLDSIPGVTSYRVHSPSDSSWTADTASKSGSEIGTWALYGGATDNNTLGCSTTLTWTGATGGGGTIPSGNDAAIGRSAICGTTEMGLQISVNADTTVRKTRIYCRSINISGNLGLKSRATLSDSSALPVVLDQTSGDTDTYFEFTYSAGSGGQTLLLQLFPETLSSGSQIGARAVTYGT